MTTLTVDHNVEAALIQLHAPAELRDASGRILGYFAPASSPTAAAYAAAASRFDPDEMRRRKESGATGHPTADVLEHLRALEKE